VNRIIHPWLQVVLSAILFLFCVQPHAFAAPCSDDDTLADLTAGTVLEIVADIDARDCKADKQHNRAMLFLGNEDGSGICVGSAMSWLSNFGGNNVSVFFAPTTESENNGLFKPAKCNLDKIVGHADETKSFHDHFELTFKYGAACPIYDIQFNYHSSGKRKFRKPDPKIGEFEKLIGNKFKFSPECKSN
jgi:hypothetical protein